MAFLKNFFIVCFLILFTGKFTYSQFHSSEDRFWVTGYAGLCTPQASSNDYLYPRYGFMAGVSFAVNLVGRFDIQSGVYTLRSISSNQVLSSSSVDAQYKPKFDIQWFSQDVLIAFNDSPTNITYGAVGFGIYRTTLTEKKSMTPPDFQAVDVTKNYYGISFGLGNRTSSPYSNIDFLFEARYHYLLSAKPYPRYTSVTIGILF